MCLQLGYVIFCQKKMGAKVACEILNVSKINYTKLFIAHVYKKLRGHVSLVCLVAVLEADDHRRGVVGLGKHRYHTTFRY